MNAELHDLAAAYALDALDPTERELFEAHLAGCSDCRVEVDEFRRAAARLGTAHGLPVSDRVRSEVLAALEHTPQRQPQHAPVAVQASVSQLPPRNRAARWVPRLLVAASLLVALGGVGAALKLQGDADDLRAERSELTSLLMAPDVAMSEKEVPGGGTLRMIGSHSMDGGMVATSDLPELPDRTYQLWTLEKGRATSRGLVGAGDSMTMLAGMGGADTLAITVEPEGGSDQPTSEPIVSVEL